jgi:hypothetical protein
MKNQIARKGLFLVMAMMALAVTGCPHNDYTVQLKPAGANVVRTLTFYRADVLNTNSGSPNYQTFDQEELAMIAGQYPAGSLTNDGNWHCIKGEFGNSLPDDVGGAGSYTNLTTSLGYAGFYVERFRGNDDLAGMVERRFKVADQLTDILIGWSKAELGRQPGYGQLHEFLDSHFRQDLKNASSYCWEGLLIDERQTNAAEEFAVRFGQYLYERDYFKLGEIPNLDVMFTSGDSKAENLWVQRLVARKMGVPDSAAIPAWLDFLADDAATEKSFTNYFAHTELYRAKVKEWKKEKKSKPEAKQPDPDSVSGDLWAQLVGIDFNLFDATPDHLTVKLSLPSEPLHCNGQWNEADKQVVWKSDIQARTNSMHLPFSCYANWAQAGEEFQKGHLGKVAFDGEDLVQYCLWRCSLDGQRGAQWDAFLAGLKPDEHLVARVRAFRFTGEDLTATNGVSSAYPRGLFENALK